MQIANVTIIGHIASDVRLNKADGKSALCRFTVAVNQSKGEESVANFYQVSAFGDLAENVAETLHKGTRVIVYGALNTYNEPIISPDDGKEVSRTRIGIKALAVGPDLLGATARVVKTERSPRLASSSSNGKAAASSDDDLELEAVGTSPVVVEEDF